MNCIAQSQKTRKNGFALGATVFCWGLALLCFVMSLLSLLRISAPEADPKVGFGISLFCAALGLVFFCWIREEDPRGLLRRAQGADYEKLREEIWGQGKTVELSGIFLSAEGFSCQKFFRRVFIAYSEITQVRSYFMEIFVNGIRAHVSYQVSLKTERGTMGWTAPLSGRLRRNLVKAVSLIERVASDIVTPKVLEDYRRGQRVDFGVFFLEEAGVSFAGKFFSFQDISSYAVNGRWLSFYLKRPGKNKPISFKRKKIWNEGALFKILTEKIPR